MRNTWRTLTSMGTALVLLFLLALGAIPGALLPQRSLNEFKVEQYIAEHPTIGPWLDRLQAFEVFSSFWFTAIYVLLFISLVGCLTPRLIEHARSLRATPVAAPRNLSRLPKHHAAEVSGDPDAVAADVTGHLRGWRRIVRKQERRHHRDLCGEGLSARVRQHRLPLLAARPARRRGRREAVRLRGQRHRRRRQRSRILLGLTRGVRLVPGRQHRGRHVAVSDLPAGQRLPGALSAHRPGCVVRRQHRLPGRLGPQHRHLAAVPPEGQRAAARRRRPGVPAGPRLRPDVHRHLPRRADPHADAAVPARRPDHLPVVGRDAVRPARRQLSRSGRAPQEPDRHPGPVRADRTARGHAAVVELPRAEQPGRGGRHLQGRHRPGHRQAAVAVLAGPDSSSNRSASPRRRGSTCAPAKTPGSTTARSSGSTAPCRSSTCRSPTTPPRFGCWCLR